MLMFQVISACAFPGSLERRDQVHVADLAPLALAQVRRFDVVAVDAAPAAAVEIEKSGAGLGEIAGRGRQQSDGAEHVAAGRLALQPLAEPEQRRAVAIERRRLFDLRRPERR